MASAFRNLDDLNAQLRSSLGPFANPRIHATARRVINEAFAEEKVVPIPFQPALRLERRAHEGMVSVGSNLRRRPALFLRDFLEYTPPGPRISTGKEGPSWPALGKLGKTGRIGEKPSSGKAR